MGSPISQTYDLCGRQVQLGPLPPALPYLERISRGPSLHAGKLPAFDIGKLLRISRTSNSSLADALYEVQKIICTM